MHDDGQTLRVRLSPAVKSVGQGRFPQCAGGALLDTNWCHYWVGRRLNRSKLKV